MNGSCTCHFVIVPLFRKPFFSFATVLDRGQNTITISSSILTSPEYIFYYYYYYLRMDITPPKIQRVTFFCVFKSIAFQRSPSHILENFTTNVYFYLLTQQTCEALNPRFKSWVDELHVSFMDNQPWEMINIALPITWANILCNVFYLYTYHACQKATC